jgi:hypothetical protein
MYVTAAISASIDMDGRRETLLIRLWLTSSAEIERIAKVITIFVG